jgi:pyruvate formate lyase activating enzyme
VDYPGKVAAVFFFPRCNLRCPWCQNRELALNSPGEAAIGLDKAFSHISKRRDVLGGVVLSGGEPTLETGLPGIIKEIKRYGLAVKLDTNGMNPLMLETLIAAEKNRPDYIALDLKLAPARYAELSTKALRGSAGEKLEQSARLIRLSRIPHEYRSLALPGGFFTRSDLEALAPLVENSSQDGAWHFRRFMPGNCLDTAWDLKEEGSREDAAALAAAARRLGKNAIFLDN